MAGDFDESAHPRAEDGKFGQGGGGGEGPRSPKAQETVAKGKAKIAAKKESVPHEGKNMASEPSTLHEQEKHLASKLSESLPGRSRNEVEAEIRPSLPSEPKDLVEFAGAKRSEAAADVNAHLEKVHAEIRKGDLEKANKALGDAVDSYYAVSLYESELNYASLLVKRRPPEGIAYELSDKVSAVQGQIHIAHTEDKFPEKYSVPMSEYHAMTDKFTEGLTPDQRFAVRNYSNHSDKVLNPLLRKSGGKPDTSLDLYTLSRDPSAGQNPDHEHSSMTTAEYKALKRDPRQNPDSSVGQELKDLDAAIASHKIDRDMTVYRTMADPGGKLLGDRNVGDTFTDHGYSSTSVRRAVIEKFAKRNFEDPSARVDVYVALKKGTNAAPIAALSAYPHERELLLPRGSSFRITKITPATASTPKQVHVEII